MLLFAEFRYLLLDEMIDSGLPFTTELNSLEAGSNSVVMLVDLNACNFPTQLVEGLLLI